MFQTSESCIKLHAVAVLELLLSEQCVCVCVCAQVRVLVRVCVLQVCVLRWVKYREHISLLVIIMYATIFFFLQNRYPIMVKCLNIWENIVKPIYRSISTRYTPLTSRLRT